LFVLLQFVKGNKNLYNNTRTKQQLLLLQYWCCCWCHEWIWLECRCRTVKTTSRALHIETQMKASRWRKKQSNIAIHRMFRQQQ